MTSATTQGPSPQAIIFEGIPENEDQVPVVFSSLPQQQSSSSLRQNRRNVSSTASVATTQLASDVGSVMGAPKIAYLKSVTWVRASDATAPLIQLDMQNVKVRRADRVALAAVRATAPRIDNNNDSNNNGDDYAYHDDDGDDTLASMLVPGHIVKSIHNQPVPKGCKAETAMEMWHHPPEITNEEDGTKLPSPYASIAVSDPNGNEVWVKATIYKPRPDMTLQELGMTVWYWGYLCIKVIEKDSIFKHTVLKSRDHIVSINNIVCDKVKPEGFEHVVKELPGEITITVCRRKQRFSGMFS